MKEVYRDEGLVEGTHTGGTGDASLYDSEVHFDISDCIGRLLENVTKGTSAVISAQTRHTVTASGVTWDDGDEYIVYVGAVKNAIISSTEVCRMSGFAYPRTELGPGGVHPKHEDRDRRVMDGKKYRK